MFVILLVVLLALAIYAPQFWIGYVLKKHAKPIDSLPGTGGDFAKHLIHEYGLEGIGIEKTEPRQDHYDNQAKMVRLSPMVYDGKSLTALAVAAHEVGHAIQFYRKEKVVSLQKFMGVAMLVEKMAIGVMMLIPIVTAILKVPQAALFTALLGVIGMFASVVFRCLLLPMELDASFNKAMPILVKGGYISADQVAPARQVLRAAAMTYVAAALANILSLWRWLAILRGAIR